MSRFRLIRDTDLQPIVTDDDGWYDIDQPTVGDIIRVTDCRQYEVVEVWNLSLLVRVF